LVASDYCDSRSVRLNSDPEISAAFSAKRIG